MTELRLDVDSRRVPKLTRIMRTCETVGLTAQYVRCRRTARGWHVRVGVREELPPAMIVALQAVMGSDWKREAFNLMRVRQLPRVGLYWQHPDRWNVLFDRKLTR